MLFNLILLVVVYLVLPSNAAMRGSVAAKQQKSAAGAGVGEDMADVMGALDHNSEQLNEFALALQTPHAEAEAVEEKDVGTDRKLWATPVVNTNIIVVYAYGALIYECKKHIVNTGYLSSASAELQWGKREFIATVYVKKNGKLFTVGILYGDDTKISIKFFNTNDLLVLKKFKTFTSSDNIGTVVWAVQPQSSLSNIKTVIFYKCQGGYLYGQCPCEHTLKEKCFACQVLLLKKDYCNTSTLDDNGDSVDVFY